MAKLFSADLEVTAVRTMAVAKANPLTGMLFSTLDESFFHYEPALAAYRRIAAIARKRGEVLDFADLLDDPSLDEEFRDLLRESATKRVKSTNGVNKLLDRLGAYRKLRVAYEITSQALNDLSQSRVDPDEILNGLADGLLRARAGKDRMDLMVRNVGHEANALDAMKTVLDSEMEYLYKTGFREYDDRNGGFPTEGVILLAGTTSGGKSVLLQNLLKQMYFLNKISVMNVSLEMQEHKLLNRHASMLTGIEVSKFIKKTATPEEKKAARIAWKKLHQFGEENECRYGYMCPTESVNMQQLLLTLKPQAYDVIGIDYAGLLDGMDADDQWRKLSAAIREAKIYSSANHCLIIVLAQLDGDTSKLRYSKGMLEHADGAWFWNYTKPEVRELRMLPIQQEKARDQELFPFELEEKFHVMQVCNPSLNVSEAFEKSKEQKAEEGARKKKRRDDDDSQISSTDDIAFEEGAGVT